MLHQPAPGDSATLTWQVAAEHAISLGGPLRGDAVVLATPAMINLMEHAARAALAPCLEEGEESVGTAVEVEHVAATPLAGAVTARATVTRSEGRLIDFEIECRDGMEIVGRGRHRRAVIRLDKFAERLSLKSRQLFGASSMSAPLPESPTPPAQWTTLLLDVEGPVARITLSRPAKRNAVNRQMTADWESANQWLASHPEIRVVVVGGAGEGFCAGDDVPEVGELSLDEARTLSLRQARMYLAWELLPQVFVARVHGNALGAGCVAACACDFRVASHDARFGMPEILLGWPPGYGIAQLTNLVGKARALDLCLLGRPITAGEAHAAGLVQRLATRAQLDAAVQDLVVSLLRMPAEALRETKRLIHRDEGLVPKQTYLDDTQAYIRCLALPAAREGIAAFREKRPPRY